jgi:hypothetical protein
LSNDIQQLLAESKQQWAKESIDKGAMSTNDIIGKLEDLKVTCTNVIIDMNGSLHTSCFEADSWRGSYNLPAISYYQSSDGCSIDEAIVNLKEIDGMDVTGYKGGDYTLNADDPLFIANYGYSNDCTAIIDIIEYNGIAVCLTSTDMY